MDGMSTAHPKIVSREEWLVARKAHLAHEKEMTKAVDGLHAERRRLPMVKLDKTYTLDATTGRVTLSELFGDRRQLIVYHFMFDPAWEKGCPGCTSFIDALGDLSMLAKKDTAFIVVSRAPLAKLQAYKKEKAWDIEWYSSNTSDFNYDFHVTLDPDVAPVEYNYKNAKQLEHDNGKPLTGEAHGLSVFFRLADGIFHTYSCFARGCENVTNAYALLDITPYGRQQEFEDSPPGWPQKPTYG
jgi:predicted dithiol-disulfide oxidoreductase (DUF899 family)